jgi:hypothetical protein
MIKQQFAELWQLHINTEFEILIIGHVDYLQRKSVSKLREKLDRAKCKDPNLVAKFERPRSGFLVAKL